MQVYHSLENFSSPKPVSATMGVFDGVHLGHLKIIENVVKVAKKTNSASLVITFNPHPRLVLNPNAKIKFLQTLEEKLFLLEKANVDKVLVLPFTKEFSLLSAQDFIEQILIDKLHISHFVIGHDHLFGNRRKGSFEILEQMGKAHNFSITQILPCQHNADIISSSAIRESLTEGNVEKAGIFLGYPYALKGTVVSGNKIGRSLGFPTLNLKVADPDKILPAKGVYASWVKIGENLYKGMTNIGFRPTLDENSLTIETNVLDFDKDVYGADITVYFMNRIREEIKFKGLVELQAQLAKDKITAYEMLKNK